MFQRDNDGIRVIVAVRTVGEWPHYGLVSDDIARVGRSVRKVRRRIGSPLLIV